MANIDGLHLLLTYRCTFECDHCFVWGSPWQTGEMTLAQVRQVLEQARRLSTIKWIYFEGGEPFLHYAALLQAVREARSAGFQVGIVSNASWAISVEDAAEWLRPLAGLVQDFSISSDLYHYSVEFSQQAQNAAAAAEQLGLPLGIISIAQPAQESHTSSGRIESGESSIMFRGRAAEKLAPLVPWQPWDNFTECPYENLRDPGRVHVDPLGEIHLCQGISLGNLFKQPLEEIVSSYDADKHPISGPLLAGGPAELVRRYNLPHPATCADACHLCYQARLALRPQIPDILTPDQVYGVGLSN